MRLAIRRYSWLLPVSILLFAGFITPLLLPFPDENTPVGTQTNLPALMLIYNSGIFLYFLILAPCLWLWRVYTREHKNATLMGCLYALPILISCTLWSQIAFRGRIEETDSFQSSATNYRLIKVNVNGGFDFREFGFRDNYYFVFYQCQTGSSSCQLRTLVQNTYGSDYLFFAHLEYQRTSGNLYLLSNDEVVFTENNVALPQPFNIVASSPITASNADHIVEAARIVHPQIRGAYWLPDGKRFIVTQPASIADGQQMGLWLYSVDKLESPQFIALQEPIQPSSRNFAFNLTRTKYATVGDDAVYIWDAINGKRIARLEGADRNSAIVFSQRGNLVAYTSKTGSQIIVYDLEKNQQWKQLTGSAKPIFDIAILAFSPDGKFLASAGLTGLRLWNLSTDVEQQLDSNSYDNFSSALQFSGDGTILSVISHSIEQWSVQSGQKLRSIGGYAEDGSVMAFSPDESLLACGGLDSTVRLWDMKNEQLLFELAPFNGDIFSTQFSPDGKFLLTASGDGLIRLWIALDSSHNLLSAQPNH
jgi:hypothetical protein